MTCDYPGCDKPYRYITIYRTGKREVRCDEHHWSKLRAIMVQREAKHEIAIKRWKAKWAKQR